MHDGMAHGGPSMDAFGLVVATAMALGYAAGLIVLARRGDRWAPARSACFFSGAASILAVTVGPMGQAGMITFSAHMIQHMTLNMVAPILLVLGAPLTLLLRTVTVPVRTRLVAALHSTPVRVLTHPALVAAVFTLSLFGLYFTPLFSVMMGDSWGHVLMQAHFLLSGYLFFWLVLGIDPGEGRPVHIARIPIVIVMVVGHTAFAFAVVFSRTPIGADYFAGVQHGGTLDLLRDQALAGGIAWGLGELSSVAVVTILLLQWFVSSKRSEAAALRARERRRQDRHGVRPEVQSASSAAPPAPPAPSISG